MSNEPVFIAIGIACVVAVLLFIVFIIYCVKKHQDKEETRLRRERRAREERHRRHMMRTQIVRPPPYDPTRQNVGPFSHNQIPMTPPPEYKEVATPIPRNRDAVGIGGVAYAPPSYAYPHQNEADQIPTVSRNVAPANTAYNSYNYFITTTAPTNGNSNLSNGNTRDNRRSNDNDNNHSNNSNNNNNTNNNRNNNDDNVQRQNGINNRAGDNTLQVHSISRGVVVAPTVSSSGAYTHSRSYDYNSPRNNGLTYSNHMQGRQAVGVVSAYPTNDRPPTYNTSNATTRANERISFDSINSYNQRLTDTTANHTTHNNERGNTSNAISYGISGSYASSSHNTANRQSSQAHDPYSYAINRASLQQGTGSSEGNGQSTNRISDLSLI